MGKHSPNKTKSGQQCSKPLTSYLTTGKSDEIPISSQELPLKMAAGMETPKAPRENITMQDLTAALTTQKKVIFDGIQEILIPI